MTIGHGCLPVFTVNGRRELYIAFGILLNNFILFPICPSLDRKRYHRQRGGIVGRQRQWNPHQKGMDAGPKSAAATPTTDAHHAYTSG